MFIIQQNNNVVYGPAEYNVGMFKYILEEDCNLVDVIVPFTLTEKIIINDNISILPVEMFYENLNEKIEQYAGPFWEIGIDKATGTFKKVDKNIEQVKNELKSIVSMNRKKYEQQTLNVTLLGIDYKIDGSRENKNNIISIFNMMMPDDVINFKFKNNEFLECTKEMIAEIITSMNKQIQNAFNFEYNKNLEIDSCIDLVSLNDIILVDINQENIKQF